MGNNSVPKFIFRLSRFPVYRGSVLGRFYCIMMHGPRNIKSTERYKYKTEIKVTCEFVTSIINTFFTKFNINLQPTLAIVMVR